MTAYKVLAIVYFISVLSSSLANSLAIDVQILYRVPFLNIRWIDVAILTITASYLYGLTRTARLITQNRFVLFLCFVYLAYQAFQFGSSWHGSDSSYQIAGLLCTLCFFILIDLSTFAKAPDEILDFLKEFAWWGALVILITNLYLVYSFIRGNVILTDLDMRVAIGVTGARETVSISVLLPFVYAFSLYFVKQEARLWKKAVYISTLLSIYASLVISFHRGNLLTIAAITIVYLFLFSPNLSQALRRGLGVAALLTIGYLLFGNALRQRGFDPLERLTETAAFAFDVNNPDWDKGRALAQEYELNVWKKHVWTGVGYNDPHNSGLPEEIASAHNFIITSLFHNGLIGTVIYLLILWVLFRNSIRLWFVLRRENNHHNDLLKLLIVVSFFWLIPFWTQEVFWEKYSLSIQFMYLGFLINVYKQKLPVRQKVFLSGRPAQSNKGVLT